jgi:hypothetical protein
MSPQHLAGNVDVKVIVEASGQGNSGTTSSVIFTYEAINQTITFDQLAAKTYGDGNFNMTATATSGLTVSFASSNTSVATVSGNTVTIVGAGTTTITASQSGNGYYNAAENVTQELIVNKRLVTVTADAKSKVYSEDDPPLTYEITSGSLVSGDAFAGALARVTGENVGLYAINKGTLSLTENYTLSYIGANLTITARSVTVTAEAKSKVYGEADPALTYQITSGSLAYSDAFTGTLTRASGENVGSYAIQQGSVALSDNYTLSYVQADLTIGKRLVTITAEAKSKTYGEADPALTYQITSGSLAYSDVFTGTLTRASGENVGSYAIQQGSVALSDNYTLSYVQADLTIGKRLVTITADAKSKTYGEADPALTYQITSGSLAFSDAFEGALTRDKGEGVGTYAIQQGTLALSSNYSLTYAGADLTITARPVTVTVDNKSKYCGQIDPNLTYQIALGSLAFSDHFSGALTRDEGENVGKHTIKRGTLALSNNYTLTFINGELTIFAVSIDVSGSSTPVPLGNDANLSALVTNTSGEPVSGVSLTFMINDDAGDPLFATSNASGYAGVSILKPQVGVYKITAIAGSGCAEDVAYLPVYDPNGGFVTGGGWILSPAGAYTPDETLTGKATFGFVSKYKKGSNVPEGNTEFQFHAGNLNFKSSVYDEGSLVVAGSKAIYKGTGTINGKGAYGFMVSAVDGQINGGGGVDRFRMKIWDATGTVYDNMIGEDDNADLLSSSSTAISGGSIVIHSVKSGAKSEDQSEVQTEIVLGEFGVKAYPNPFTDHVYFDLQLKTDSKVRLEIYNSTGAKIATVFDDMVVAFDRYRFEYTPGKLSSSVLIYRIFIDNKMSFTGKLIHR